ncbi:MAG: hypothetical protein STSR0008_25480 [Ignavibacterium sp.]
MKVKLLVISIVILGTYFVYPQEKMNYGIKIGLTSSNLSKKNIKSLTIGNPRYYVNYSDGQLISPTITFWAKLINSDILDLEVETSYILKGSSENRIETVTPGNDADLITEVNKSVTFKYFQININTQIKQNVSDVLIYGIVGPTVGYLFDAENFILLTNFKKDFILGYNLGLGIGFNKNIFIEIKYNGDFSSFYKNDYDEYWNKVWIFNIGTSL